MHEAGLGIRCETIDRSRGTWTRVRGEDDPASEVGLPEGVLQALVGMIPAAVFVEIEDPTTRRGYRGAYISAYVETLLGYTPAEILADHELWIRDIVHPDDRVAVLSEITADREEGHLRESTYRAIRKDGRVITVHDVDRLTATREGRFHQGVVVGISDAAKIRRSLAATDRRVQALIEQLPLVTFIL